MSCGKADRSLVSVGGAGFEVECDGARGKLFDDNLGAGPVLVLVLVLGVWAVTLIVMRRFTNRA